MPRRRVIEILLLKRSDENDDDAEDGREYSESAGGSASAITSRSKAADRNYTHDESFSDGDTTEIQAMYCK